MPVQLQTPTAHRNVRTSSDHHSSSPASTFASSSSPVASPKLKPQSCISPQAVIEQLSAELRKRIGSHKYNMWFGHTCFALSKGLLAVNTDSKFVARWIESHFTAQLREIVMQISGESVEVQVRVDPQAVACDAAAKPQVQIDVKPASPAKSHAAREPRTLPSAGERDRQLSKPASPLRSETRRPRTDLRKLSDFVVGPANRLAHATACRLAEESDPRGVSPLFIHGECGVGKTHLLQGVCHRYIELTGRSQHVRYVTGEQFTNEYITAIRNNSIDAFRNKVRKLDLLAIDDVHFLSNKVRTQAEFLYTLDAIDLSGARVVLASDNHPHHIKRFNQALVNRFISGMVVKVDRPDRAMRLELITRLAAQRGLRINAAAVELIASNCLGSVRELEGAITKLAAYKSLMNGDSTNSSDGEIGVVLAEQLFRDNQQTGRMVRMSAVVEAVCQRLGVSRADVLGSGRHRRIVLARGLTAFLGRELTTHSFPEIAEALGRTNHSTIHTADQRLRRQIAENESAGLAGADQNVRLRDLADEIRHRILNGQSAAQHD